jgi:Spy/CpxP family protein refolding chaperone
VHQIETFNRKNRMKRRTVLTHLVLTAVLLSGLAIQAVAQGRGGGGAGGILTPEQRTKIRESLQSSQTELTQLSEKLAAAQKEAIKAALAKDADEKSVRPKIEAVTKLQTEIALLRLKAVKEVAPTLTDDQKTQIENRPGVAYTALLGGLGGGGGGGGRRGAGAGAGGTQ